jgi:hypothetical protein
MVSGTLKNAAATQSGGSVVRVTFASHPAKQRSEPKPTWNQGFPVPARVQSVLNVAARTANFTIADRANLPHWRPGGNYHGKSFMIDPAKP